MLVDMEIDKLHKLKWIWSIYIVDPDTKRCGISPAVDGDDKVLDTKRRPDNSHTGKSFAGISGTKSIEIFVFMSQ